jgi:hypothetical protein
VGEKFDVVTIFGVNHDKRSLYLKNLRQPELRQQLMGEQDPIRHCLQIFPLDN